MDNQSQRIIKFLSSNKVLDLTAANADGLVATLNNAFQGSLGLNVHMPGSRDVIDWVPHKVVTYTRAEVMKVGVMIYCLEEQFGPFRYDNDSKIAIFQDSPKTPAEGFFVSQEDRDFENYSRVFLLEARGPALQADREAYSFRSLEPLIPVMA